MSLVKRKKKRTIYYYLVSLALVTLFVCYLQTEPLYAPTAITSIHHSFTLPKFIAHKARVSGKFEANTKEALREAISSPVQGIEIDVRLSKDKIPFIYHGNNLASHTNGQGKPEEKTWEELKKYRYLQNNTAILSLEEALNIVGSAKFVFLDLKGGHIFDQEFAQIIVNMIHKYHLEDSVTVESFNPFLLGYIRLAARDIMITLDFTENNIAGDKEIQEQFNEISWLIRRPFIQKQIRRIIRPDILAPRWNVPHSSIRKLIAHGYPIVSWTIDDPDIAHQLFALGVDSIQSNVPLKLMNANQLNLAVKIMDAGGTSSTPLHRVNVIAEEDVIDAIKLANATNMFITLAGRNYSMGGQSLLDGSISLNLLGFNAVNYDPNTTHVTAQSGATWKKVQAILNSNGRAVKVMQSDNVFTIGGSISSNVHGWQVGSPPIASTIVSMKVAMANGEILKVSPTENSEIFRAVIGGYGQFAVIIEVELETCPNNMLEFDSVFMSTSDFSAYFSKLIEQDPAVELAYGRLSVDTSNFLEEAGLFWYRKAEGVSTDEIIPENLVAFKRTIFRSSEFSDYGKKSRWMIEKRYSALNNHKSFSRNSVMSSDIHVLWPMRKGHIDILQEYFIPKSSMNIFVERLKKTILKHKMNLLNATIREVKQDDISLLSYARTDVFGFVLLFSEKTGDPGEIKMQNFTRELINEVTDLGGTFYLPYRLHYTYRQLMTSYPMIEDWLAVKNRLDHKNVFSSNFLEYITNLIEVKE